jgi:cytochrome c551/c552
MAVNPELHPGVNAELGAQFVDWIVSPDTQKLIGGYGADEFGQPLFYASSDETKATREVSVKIGDAVKSFTLEDLKALPAVTLAGYEATGHKKGPLGANDWTGAALKDVLLAVDPEVGDPANAGKFFVIRASDGWRSVVRWNQIFGEPKGGEALADSYGCTECHGYAGEGTAPAGKTPTPALAGKGWTAEALGVLMRAGHGGILPYKEEQMSDEDIAAIALWLEDPAAEPPADAYAVPEEQMVTLLAYERNGEEMNGRDGLLQLIMGMDKYTSRYAHWVKTIELMDAVE